MFAGISYHMVSGGLEGLIVTFFMILGLTSDLRRVSLIHSLQSSLPIFFLIVLRAIDDYCLDISLEIIKWLL